MLLLNTRRKLYVVSSTAPLDLTSNDLERFKLGQISKPYIL